jgi:integrase
MAQEDVAPMPHKPSQKRKYGSGSIFEKNGAVVIRFRPVPGKSHVQRKICNVGEMNGKEIEAKAQKIMVEVKEGIANPPEPQAPESDGPTFGEVAEAHIRELEALGKARSYTRNRWRQFGNHLKPTLGDRPVRGITTTEMRQFQRDLLERTGKPTVVSVMVLASGIFKYAIEQEFREDNPTYGIKRPKVRKQTRVNQYLTVEEVEAVIRAIPNDELGKVERIMYRVAQHTGMRRSELLAFKWKHIAWQSHFVWVVDGLVEDEETDTKNHEARTVPLTEELARALERWFKETRYNGDDDLVLGHPITGRPLKAGTVSKRFKRALVEADIGAIEMRDYKIRGQIVKRPFSPLRLHDLRHSFGTTMAMDPDVSLKELQTWMGHKDPMTTEIYSHFQPKADAAERAGKAFERARGQIVHQDCAPEGEEIPDPSEFGSASKPTPGLEPGTPSLRVKCSTN